MKKKTVDKEKTEEVIIQEIKKDGKKKEDKQKNKKIPKDVSQEIMKKILRNLFCAIGLMLYFFVLNYAYTKMKEDRLINDIKVFAGAFLVSGIFMFERAYKKDSGRIVITAIELIVLSIHSLTIMHVISLFKYDFRFYLLTSSYIISVYFVLKSIIIYTKGRREYWRSLSDISTIVKDDEPVIKEATKKGNSEIKGVPAKKKSVKVETKVKDKTEKKISDESKKTATKSKKKEKPKIEKDVKPKIEKDVKPKIEKDVKPKIEKDAKPKNTKKKTAKKEVKKDD